MPSTGVAGVIGGSNSGATMVQSLVSQFVPFGGGSENGENVGNALPFQEYFNLGAVIHQQLTGAQGAALRMPNPAIRPVRLFL
ncbi:unnamed protein product [Toxocara canis]|uniref:Uncharacterized protein n=1 Tax=Toxocara canis TaxID=6265 RepID=A0A183UT39_TOXCA|nr:unnamed protein product [Toxocara canis]